MPPKSKVHWLTGLASWALLLAAGCGDNLAQVYGHVTLNGEPLASTESISGTVYFFPAAGTGAPALGLLNSEGKYELATGSKSGIQPGQYLVTVSASEIIPAKDPESPPNGRLITPLQYANPKESGFRANVSHGSNEFDFSLEGNHSPIRRRR